MAVKDACFCIAAAVIAKSKELFVKIFTVIITF